MPPTWRQSLTTGNWVIGACAGFAMLMDWNAPSRLSLPVRLEQVLHFVRHQLAVDLAVRISRQAPLAHRHTRRHHERGQLLPALSEKAFGIEPHATACRCDHDDRLPEHR